MATTQFGGVISDRPADGQHHLQCGLPAASGWPHRDNTPGAHDAWRRHVRAAWQRCRLSLSAATADRHSGTAEHHTNARDYHVQSV